jgi:hypothetical protein
MASPSDNLPRSNAGRCTNCGDWLYYQRVDHRVGVLEHYFFCRRCRRQYAAWEQWTPGGF